MREILFRGRTVSESEYYDDGEWIEGFYTCFNGDEHRIYTGYSETGCGDHYPDWFNVLPETVGQYTEMEDKHGKKIFEGDIIYRDWFGGRTYQVTYDNLFGGFMGVTSDETFTTFDGDSDFFEVIGNIYDNPELMNKN